MVRATGLHSDVDCRIAAINAVVRAFVRGFHDIGAMLRQNSCQSVQRAGVIGKMDPQANKAAILYQTTLDDAGKQGDVDIASAHQQGYSLSGQRNLTLEESVYGRCSCSLSSGFLALLQKR